jgi:hypothetical protein
VRFEAVARGAEQRQRHRGRQQLAARAAQARQRAARVNGQHRRVRQEDQVRPRRRPARDDGARDPHAAAAMNERARVCLPTFHSRAHYMLLEGERDL